MKALMWVVIWFCLFFVMLLAACSQSVTVTPDPNAAKPSNAGGLGQAVSLQGDASRGKEIFQNTCSTCHGEEGKGGVENAGSDDGTVPTLNPIDETLVNKDPKVFGANLDLFLEHGSTPAGTNPAKVMLNYGDSKVLTSQQIADVIAYIISLNPPK
ncbi:MAG TPA: cytochrome c [Anaerolineaceae bacterium]|nr:cytochrome c [Anaerolineaceae bacterium]